MSEAGQNSAAAADAEPAVASASASVGHQLRQAREAAQLSHQDIAQVLKFSPRQIEALEADNYGALPGATIVRGFVRSYARLLGIDAVPLLRQLEPVIPSVPTEIRPPENMGIANQAHDARERSSLLIIAIVLMLAAAMLALWHFWGPAMTQGATTTTITSRVPETPRMQAPIPTENSALTPVPASVENVMPPQLAQQTDPDAPVLRFDFADRSWIEVIDANKRVLHSGENPGGSQLMLTGKPPFEIVVGNAGKVTLKYGERLVDLAPYMRADVARLTLE